jgi:choice-of-anchor C domain-containing protein
VLLRLFSTTVSLGVGSTFTQEALAANLVSFQHDGGEADGSFTVSLTDGTAPAQTRTVVATVNPHVNDPPVLAGDGVVVVQEGGSAVVQTTDLAASDPDTPDSVLTYTLTGASHVTVLRSGLNLLVGDTFLQEDIAAGRITVEHDGGEADGSFTVSLTDGTAPAQTRTVTATVNPHVNDAPVFHGLDGTPATNEGVPVRLDPSVTISDAELDLRNGGAGNYAGASLVIARHNDPGMHQHDTFGFDTAGALFTVVGNELRAGGLTFATFTAPTGPVAGTGILTIAFTGAQTAATTALVNDVVQRILYANTNDNPPANPRLDYLFDDGGGQGLGGHQTAQGHVFVTITPVNDAPVNTVPGAQSVAEDTGLVFSAANGNAVTVADPDIGAGGATVTLSVLHGTLTLGSVAGLTALSGDGTGTVTLTGTLGDINAALSGLTYQGNPNFNGADTLKVETSDNGNSGTGGTLTDTDTVAITVTAVNDAPGIGFTPVINLIQNGSFESPALPSGGFIFGATGTTITNWFVSQGDVDLITSWQSAEGNQSLELNGFQRGAIQQSFATTVGQSYTVRFSLAGNPDPGNANDFVHDLRVSATGASPQTYVFDSTSHTASSMGWTNEFFTFVATATTTTVTFESLDTGNSGPALDGVSVVLAFAIPVTEDTATRLSGITISEDDSGTADITVTYAIPAGSGTLSASAGGGVEVDGSGTRTLTLTGTIAEIQAYLNDLSLGVTYTPAQDRDTDTTLTVTVNDNGATGAGGPQIVSRDFTLDLVPADEAPTNNAPTITASAPPTLLFGEIADGIEESAATDAFVGFGDVYWLSTGHNSTSVGYQDEYGDFTLIHSVSGTLGFNFKAGHLYALGGFSTTSALGDVLFVAGDSFLYDNATDDASPSRKAMFAVYPTNGSGTGGPAYTPPGETFPSIPPAFTYNTREFFAADGDEGFRGIATDAASGHVYAVGFGDAGSGSSLLVAEYDTTGQLLHWAVDPRIVADDGLPVGDYSGSEQSSVANDAGWFDGHLWVFGAYDSGSGYRPSVWEYDADLNIQQQLLPPDGGEFLGATVAGGFLYAVGDTTDASDGQDALIVKYDAAGVPVWTTTFDGDGTDSNSGGDAFDDIVATEDGRLFAVGYTTNALGRFGVTLEIDPATGDVLTRTNSGVGYDRNTAVATDGTNLYVTETEEPDGPSGGLFLTYAIDPTVVEDGVAANGDFRGLYFVTVQLTIGDSDGDPVRYVTDGWTPVEPDGEGPWTSLFNANGHHYAVIYNNGLTWDEAEAGAEGLGGYLATITDADENTFIKNLLDGGSFYIGGSDPDLNGSWHWATGPEAGEEFWDHGPVGDAYANWDLDAGEPTGDFEPFALIRGDGFWNDGDGDPESDGVDGYVIEFSRFSLEGIYGRLELDTATGEATYVLDDFDPDTQALREGDIVTDHFEIVVADSHGAQTTLPLDFTVIGSNDPADAQELKVVRFADDLTAPFALDLAAPVDPDDGPGTLHVFIDELPTHGTIRLASGAPLSPGQEITVAELTGLLFDPADDATGGAYAAKEMFFRYTVWDGHGANFLGDQATVVLEQISTTTPAAQGTLPFSESSSTSMSSAYHPIADEFAGFDTGGLSLSGTGYAYGSFFGGDGTFMATDGAEFAVSSLMVAGFNGATAIRVTAYDFDDLVWQGDYDVTSGGPFVLVEPDADGASTGPITQLRIRPLAGGFSYGQLKVDDVSFSTVSSYVGAYSDDLLTGGALADRLHGLNGDDTMTGGAGDDLLAGGYGQDVMDGGAGADTYRFAWIDESGPTAETADLILGFTSGQDKIDLSAIDADVTTTFNDDFEWGDQNPNAVANSVTWFQDAAHNRTVIQMDNNGDAIADMMIVIAGLKTLQHDDFYGLNGL